MRRVPAIVLLALVYALAVGSLHPLDLATGAVVGFAALRGLGRATGSVPFGEWMRRAAAFPHFALVVARGVVAGTVQVALIVVGLRPAPRSGIVEVPMEERTETGVAVAALALTLSPGEVLVAVDWEGRRMLIHTIDATDPDELRARHSHLYQRFQRRVFP